MVDAPEQIRIERIKKRDGRSELEIKAIMKQQWPSEKIRSKANFIIENDGSNAVIQQVLQIHQQLLDNVRK